MILAQADEGWAVTLFERSNDRPVLVARKGQVVAARGGKEARAMHFLGGAQNDFHEIGIAASAKQTLVERLIGPKSAAMVVRFNGCGMQGLNSLQFV